MGDHGHHTSYIFQKFNKKTTFANYLLIVDAYSKNSKIYEMENVTTEKVMNKLDIFQSRFGKVDEFGWWNVYIFQTDYGTQFTYK